MPLRTSGRPSPTTQRSSFWRSLPRKFQLQAPEIDESQLHCLSRHLTVQSSLGGFEYGYQQGVLGQALVMFRFQANFPSVTASTAATGWLTSILQLGGLLGSLTAGTLSDIISRKYTMFIACLWVILGSFLYIGASDNKADLLYAGRFFTGIGVGLFSGVGPLYNAELSAPEMRGLLVSFYQVSPDEGTSSV